MALALVVASACSLPANLLFKCGSGGECPSGLTCGADNYCRPPDSDGGTGGGGGGTGGGGVGGGGGCTPVDTPTACGGAACGFADAGCGVEVLCPNLCPAGQECGTNNACRRPNVCSNGWCWENPLPQGEDIRTVLALSERDVWLGGDNCTVLHYDGQSFSFALPPSLVRPGVTIEAMHGLAPGNVFAVGTAGTIFHWDGSNWSDESVTGGSVPDFESVLVLDNGDAVAGADSALYWRQSSGGWLAQGPVSGSFTSTFMGLAQVGDQVYAMARNQGLFRKSRNVASAAWQLDRQPPRLPSQQLFSVDGTLLAAAPFDAGVLPDGGPLADGGGFTVSALYEAVGDGGWEVRVRAPVPVRTLLVPSRDEVWVAYGSNALQLTDGGAPRLVQTSDTVYALAANPQGRLFTAGNAGAVATWSAAEGLHDFAVGTVDSFGPLCQGPGVGELYCATTGWGCPGPSCYGMVAQRAVSLGSFTWDDYEYYKSLPGDGVLTACAVEASSGTVFVPTSGLGVAYLPPSKNGLYLLSADAGVPAGSRFGGAYAGPGTPVFLAGGSPGGSPLVLARPPGGGTFAVVYEDTSTAGHLNAIAGVATTVVAAGSDGGLYRDTGGGWQPVASPGTAELFGLHGASLLDGGQLWLAVGAGGTVWRSLDGASFTADVAAPLTAFPLLSVWVSPTGEAWAVGGSDDVSSDLFRRRADGGWEREPIPSVSLLRGVLGRTDADAGTETIWVSGNEGLVLRRGPP